MQTITGVPDRDSWSLFVSWFERNRSLFAEHFEHDFPDWEKRFAHLRRWKLESPPEVSVCLIGRSGIGKSTLINALVGGEHTLVPAGGIGPLTTHAIEVLYGERCNLEVAYHPPAKFRDLLLGLRSTQQNTSRDHLDDAHIVKTAKMMIVGDSDAAIPVDLILGGLASAVNPERLIPAGLPDVAWENIGRLRTALQLGKSEQSCRYEALDANDTDFNSIIFEHASGFLSPVIRRMRLSWPNPLLSDGLVLVDLPGVGQFADQLQEVTAQWMRKSARAVLLVINSRGLGEEEVRILYTSGFLNRLLYSASRPDLHPVKLFLVVTRLDEVADAEYNNNRNKTKVQHFTDAVASVQEKTRLRFRELLLDVWSKSTADPEMESMRYELLERLVSDTEIVPVSAIQYRRLLAADPEDPAFLKEEEASGIPRLARILKQHAAEYRLGWSKERNDAAKRFCNSVIATIKQFVEMKRPSTGVLKEELRRLAECFPSEVSKRRELFQRRHGEFNQFVSSGLVDLVSLSIEQVKNRTEKALRKIVNEQLMVLQPNTLQAIVRKSGRHGKINLPNEFSLEFDASFARVLNESIAARINETYQSVFRGEKKLLADLVSFVGRYSVPDLENTVRRIAEGYGFRNDDLELRLEEKIEYIRKLLNAELAKGLRDQIESECKKFKREEKNEGSGVKRRIEGLLLELVDKSVNFFADISNRLLKDQILEINQLLRRAIYGRVNPFDVIENEFARWHSENEDFIQPEVQVGEDWYLVLAEASPIELILKSEASTHDSTG